MPIITTFTKKLKINNLITSTVKTNLGVKYAKIVFDFSACILYIFYSFNLFTILNRIQTI